MIKVIGKTFDIISLLSKEGALPLREIATGTGLNKTTASNIVITLRNLGWLSQNDKGDYYISDTFIDLSRAYINKDRLDELLDEQVTQAANQIGERVLCATLRHGARHILKQADGSQLVTISEKIADQSNVYDSATGRVLVAYMTTGERNAFYAEAGVPTEKEWPGAADETKVFKEIRDNGYELKPGNEVVAIAVPVFGKNGKVSCSLGCYLPDYRCNSELEAKIIRHLKGSAEIISERLP